MITISPTYFFIWNFFTFVGLCAPFWSIFLRKNSPPDRRSHLEWEHITELFLSSIMKYSKNDND